MSYEVGDPIICSPYNEPAEHWHIDGDAPPLREPGRRPAAYFWHDPKAAPAEPGRPVEPQVVDLPLVNLIRERVKDWRQRGWPGATRTTRDLLHYWRREGRRHRLFFAQVEAAETIIFLTEGPADVRQGTVPPRDAAFGFLRYACKMATGTGKTTVMGMLAAWSILNKTADRGDARFADTVLVVCPNVTIRNRLGELDPHRGEASLYRTRDLVPPEQMPRLRIDHW